MYKSPDKVVSLALKEVGYCEKASNSQLESKTDNAGNANWNKYAAFIDQKYPTFYNGKKNGYDWCDIFVDYLFLKCYGLKEAMEMLYQPAKSCGAGCGWSRTYYKVNSRYSKEPTIGAQIFFTKDNGKTVYHTGIVTSISGDMITVVEGNSGNKVTKNVYHIDSPKIDGYGAPKYSEVEAMKTIEEIAKEVIAGSWGNGAERKAYLIKAGYDPVKVQDEVNKIINGNKNTTTATKKGIYTIDVDTSKYKQIVINLI